MEKGLKGSSNPFIKLISNPGITKSFSIKSIMDQIFHQMHFSLTFDEIFKKSKDWSGISDWSEFSFIKDD